jgi:predicted DNA-binding transcriptional regulator AlpA
MADQQTIEPLLLPVCEVVKLLGISRSVFYSWLSAGKIGPVEIRLGDGAHAKPLFSLVELRRWIDSKDPETGILPSRQRWIEIQENQRCQNH